MFVTVQFKDINHVFKGKLYDYELNKEEEVPEKGSIIRMLDEDYNYICNGTRVKVVDIKATSTRVEPTVIRYIQSSMEE